MQERVGKYVHELFSDIPESKELCDLKEEVCANLHERIMEYMSNGGTEEDAFQKAVAELGDVSELASSMKKGANEKTAESIEIAKPLKKHIFFYVIVTALCLFGILSLAFSITWS